MLIRLKTELASMVTETGTLYVIDGPMDFKKTDGYIQFLNLALDAIRDAYGEQSKQWKWQTEHIRNMAGRLCDTNVRFTGDTRDRFINYCKKVAHVLADGPDTQLPRLKLIKKEGGLKAFMEEQIGKGYNLGFYYQEGENTEKLLMHDLMEQLASLKLEKTTRKYDISPYLCNTMYHEHVHDALNTLIQAAVYFINCRSTQECLSYAFDVYEMDTRLDYVESIIRRTESVI